MSGITKTEEDVPEHRTIALCLCSVFWQLHDCHLVSYLEEEKGRLDNEIWQQLFCLFQELENVLLNWKYCTGKKTMYILQLKYSNAVSKTCRFICASISTSEIFNALLAV